MIIFGMALLALTSMVLGTAVKWEIDRVRDKRDPVPAGIVNLILVSAVFITSAVLVWIMAGPLYVVIAIGFAVAYAGMYYGLERLVKFIINRKGAAK